MFNFTGGEFLILLVVALIVLGPDKLPDAARKVGSLLREARQMSTGFRRELMDAIDEPSKEMRSTFVDPMKDIRSSLLKPLDDLKETLRSPVVPPAAAAASGAETAESVETTSPETPETTAPENAPPTPPAPAKQPPTARSAPAPSRGLEDDDGLLDFLDLPVRSDDPGHT